MLSNKNKIINTENFNILIDNIVIDQVDNNKFSGVIINSNQTWLTILKLYPAKTVRV